MGGRIDTIFMWIKFGDDPISSLDFSFTGGGVPLNALKDYLSYEYQWRLAVENIGYDELLMQKSRDTYIRE